jgi:hypothetical protein
MGYSASLDSEPLQPANVTYMLRKESGRPQPPGEKLTEAECKELAENFADMILDPSTPWVRTSILTGLQLPETSKEVARRSGFPAGIFDSPACKVFADALERMDRNRLGEILMSELLRDPPTKEQAEGILKLGDPSLMRGALREAERMFQGKRGRKPKIAKRDYPKLAERASTLRPIILKLLAAIRSDSRSSIRDLLESWKAECPEACTFLLHHLGRLELALKDQRLRARASGLEARAGVLAEALAGADYKLRFSTSIERTREGRRMMARPA